MYRRNRLCTGSTCCIEGMGESIDPAAVAGTVEAGNVCRDEFNTSCLLSKIYFPTQEYRAGFTPECALENGTMFPELVRLYK